MKKIFFKTIIILAGILFFLIIIEISLRIFGYFYEAKTKTNNIFNKNNYTILCIGDSHTRGIGAQERFDYPTQLSELLNQNTNIKFNVINCGIGGNNSSNILERLPIEINKYNPSLIILLAGGANTWKYYNLNSSKIKNIFYNLRIVKLTILLYHNISDLKSTFHSNDDTYYYNLGVSYYSSDKYEEAFKCFEKAISINNKKMLYYSRISLFYKSIGRFDYNIKYLEQGLKINKNSDTLLLSLIQAYNSKAYYQKSLETAKRGIITNPLCINFYKYLNSLRDITEINKKEINEFYSNHKIDMNKKYYFIENSKTFDFNNIKYDDDIKLWVEKDIDNIIKIIKNKNIKLIMMNYYYNISINNILENIADKNNIPFVNNYKSFLQLGNDYMKYREPKCFGPRAHPNEKGYNLIAKNIYNKIIEEKIFNIDTIKTPAAN